MSSIYQLGDLPPKAGGWKPLPTGQPPDDGAFPDKVYQSTYESLRSTTSRRSDPDPHRTDDEATLLPKHLQSPNTTSPPYSAAFFSNTPHRWWWWRRWNSAWNLYLFFAFGVACAIGHHAYYDSLDGKPAADQQQMLRYGMALAFASKAGLSAAVVLAFRQRVWTTVRTRMMRVDALDSLFAASEDLWALLNWEMIRTAKIAVALAVFVW